MKIIALEEHFWTAGIRDANHEQMPAVFADRIPKLEDLGEQRIKDMDRAGVDVQVISHTTPATQTLPASKAIPLAKDANDQLAAAIGKHPNRFAGFATLPTPDPDAAAQELERAIRVLHFKDAMINGRTGTRFLDDREYTPILEAATSLDVPLYLHPTRPPEAVQNAYYAGFDPAVSFMLANAGWGDLKAELGTRETERLSIKYEPSIGSLLERRAESIASPRVAVSDILSLSGGLQVCYFSRWRPIASSSR